MKNPLRKRYIRELKSEFGKYFVIFTFVVGMVSIISGYLIAGSSISTILEKAFNKYNIEDGNFEIIEMASDNLLSELEQENITVYENFFQETKTTDFNSTLRIFINRKDINKESLTSGKLPLNKNQVAIDRVYAHNNKLNIGDNLTLDNKTYEITGFVALSDYNSLYQSNNDMMYENIKFGVGVMNDEGFYRLGENHLHYSYSWKYHDKPKNEDAEKDASDQILEVLLNNGMVINFVPLYSNLAINFGYDDVALDDISMKIFLNIIMIILAFVVAITTATTIVKESNVIGTLRASGYTKKEMLYHYMSLPVIVIFIGTIVGNVLAYTLLKGYMVDSYYARYSFPEFQTTFNAQAFIYTSIIPTILMILIIYIVLSNKLKLSPLKLIRKDLNTKNKSSVLFLNDKFKISTRFRIRILLQNVPTYLLFFIGIFLANFIMMFGFLFNPMLNNYADTILDNKLSNYQYILKAPIITENKNAEIYCANYLHDVNISLENENVMIYGIEEDSNFVDIDTNKIYISDGYSKKYNIHKGDKITLKETYGSKRYEFMVDEIYNYPSTISLFMGIDQYRQIFDLDKEYFNGYFSNTKLNDIDEFYIANIITEDELTKVSNNLTVSLGSLMDLFIGFGAVVFTLLIYLLSKIVIEKNSQNISLTKVLGYSNSEINKFYIMTNSIVALVSIIVTVPICNIIMEKICFIMFAVYPQYFPYYMPSSTFIKVIIMGIIIYTFIAYYQSKKAKKVPLDLALKNIE